MAKAIDQARRAFGRTSPNPMVGCVVVKGGEVLATGFHSGPGRAHAEVDALRKLESRQLAGSEVYVNLEPCCHHGRTPPCTDALLEAGVERVYVGIEDPDPRVSGEGIARLRQAGVDVVVGVLPEKSRQLNRAYITYMNEGRPWVAAKWAMSLDGKIGTRTGHSAWITGEAARQRVHQYRDVYDAIMVGTGTLRADNPRLTCRIDGGHDPIRVVLDARLEAPLDSNVYAGGDDAPQTLVAVGAEADAERVETLGRRGLEVLELQSDPRGWLPVRPLLARLAERGIVRLFVEGGGGLLGSLYDEELIDHVHTFVSPKLIGGTEAISPLAGLGCGTVDEGGRLEDPSVEVVGSDVLISGDVEYPER